MGLFDVLESVCVDTPALHTAFGGADPSSDASEWLERAAVQGADEYRGAEQTYIHDGQCSNYHQEVTRMSSMNHRERFIYNF